MKQKINYLYLVGGLIILILGGVVLYLRGNFSDLITPLLPVAGIIYLLYAFNLRQENKSIKISFFLLLISSIVSISFNPNDQIGFAVLYFFFAYVPFILGFVLLITGVFISILKK